jgi:hypothetical protein
MKMTSTKSTIISHNNTFNPTARNRGVDHVIISPQATLPARVISPLQSAEEELTSRIFKEKSGKALMKFCRELTMVLIRRYSIDEDASDLRDSLCDSLESTLKCTRAQANSLIDLSLEMIHAKVRGKYRRTDLEISYLIATATGAVSDISSN